MKHDNNPVNWPLNANIHPERISGLTPAKMTMWKQNSSESWELIAGDMRQEPVNDGDLNWVPASIRSYVHIKRTMIQKLMNKAPEETIRGPEDRDMRATGKVWRSAFVIWMKNAGMKIDQEIERRWAGREGVEKIGSSVALLRDITPLRFQGTTAQRYFPRQHLAPAQEVRSSYIRGMTHILGQVHNLPKEGEHFAADLLREIKEFRATKAGWAEIDDRGAIRALEDGHMTNGWMAVMPPEEQYLRTPASPKVVQNGNIHIAYLPPYAITTEWAGLIGIHEIRHLLDRCMGKEPLKPTRKEFIDGEVRAFSGEIGAADIYSKGKLSNGLDEVISQFGLTEQSIIELAHNPDFLSNVAHNLDTYITEQPAKSHHEASMRTAFYLMALAFRNADTKLKDTSDRWASYARTVEALYEAEGVLPKE